MTLPTLFASILCEDVLPSALIDGRVTLYRLVFDLSADHLPARARRLFGVNLWHHDEEGEYTARMQVLTPAGQVAAEGVDTFALAPRRPHTQIVRLDDLVLPQAGRYAIVLSCNDHIVQTYPLWVTGPAGDGDEDGKEKEQR